MASDKERQEAIEAARAIIAKMNALDPEERARLEELRNKNESVFPYIQTLAGAGFGRRLRTVRGQTLDCFPDTRDRCVAVVNLLARLQAVERATPAKLFQMSARRETGHSPVILASSFAVENDCDWSAPAASPTSAVMLLSASIVNVDMLVSP